MAEANRVRAMELFEKQRKARIAASMSGYDAKKRRYCRDCNARLSKLRLRAQPFACRCTPCAEIIERNGFV